MSKHLNPNTRHDFRLLFEVENGNPNGDPDNGNQPRIDFETQQALVTDVCIKRKIRDYVTDLVQLGELPREKYDIYVERGAELNLKHQIAVNRDSDKDGKPSLSTAADRARVMCERFYDVRMFGAMMATKVHAGVVRGPVQFNVVARSIDPVIVQTLGITRVARTEKNWPKDASPDKPIIYTDGTMGDKHYLRYALFSIDGFVTARCAHRTGVNQQDMEVLWDALQRMWDNDRAAARGRMATRGLYVFSHDHPLGNAPAHELLDRIQVQRTNPDTPVSSFHDYEVTVRDDNLPEGVTLTTLVG